MINSGDRDGFLLKDGKSLIRKNLSKHFKFVKLSTVDSRNAQNYINNQKYPVVPGKFTESLFVMGVEEANFLI